MTKGKKGVDIFKELSIRGPHQEVKRCQRMGKIFSNHIQMCLILLGFALLCFMLCFCTTEG